MNGGGLSGAAQRVAEHARSFVRLELELAAKEMKRKLAALGIGIGLTLTAAALGLLALVFGLAAGTAAIATVWPVWRALLVMFGGLMLGAMLLGAVGLALLRRGTKPLPEHTLEEARLTTEALRNGNGE